MESAGCVRSRLGSRGSPARVRRIVGSSRQAKAIPPPRALTREPILARLSMLGSSSYFGHRLAGILLAHSLPVYFNALQELLAQAVRALSCSVLVSLRRPERQRLQGELEEVLQVPVRFVHGPQGPIHF